MYQVATGREPLKTPANEHLVFEEDNPIFKKHFIPERNPLYYGKDGLKTMLEIDILKEKRQFILKEMESEPSLKYEFEKIEAQIEQLEAKLGDQVKKVENPKAASKSNTLLFDEEGNLGRGSKFLNRGEKMIPDPFVNNPDNQTPRTIARNTGPKISLQERIALNEARAAATAKNTPKANPIPSKPSRLGAIKSIFNKLPYIGLALDFAISTSGLDQSMTYGQITEKIKIYEEALSDPEILQNEHEALLRGDGSYAAMIKARDKAILELKELHIAAEKIEKERSTNKWMRENYPNPNSPTGYSPVL